MYKNPYTHLSGEIDDKKVSQAGFQERQFDTGEVTLNNVVGPNNGDPLILIPAQMGI